MLHAAFVSVILYVTSNSKVSLFSTVAERAYPLLLLSLLLFLLANQPSNSENFG